MYTIKIEFEEEAKSAVELNNIQSGQTLLEICLKHKVEIPHECGGVCFCRTCHVYIEKGFLFFEDESKREKDFIERIPNRDSSSRLACQCLLNEGQGEIEIRLPVP